MKEALARINCFGIFFMYEHFRFPLGTCVKNGKPVIVLGHLYFLFSIKTVFTSWWCILDVFRGKII